MNIINMPVGPIGTNCYILSSKEDKCAVIDPGAQPDKIIGEIEERGLTPVYILITHGHHDHIGGIKRILEKYPEAELYIGKNDLEMLQDSKKSMASFRSSKPDEFIIEKAGTLSDGQELELDELVIRVIDSPGHTKGGVCYLCGDAMFSGDTLFYENVGRCDLYGGSYEVLKESLKRLAELEGDFRVFPGHGGATTLAHERSHNRYVAEACS